MLKKESCESYATDDDWLGGISFGERAVSYLTMEMFGDVYLELYKEILSILKILILVLYV